MQKETRLQEKSIHPGDQILPEGHGGEGGEERRRTRRGEEERRGSRRRN